MSEKTPIDFTQFSTSELEGRTFLEIGPHKIDRDLGPATHNNDPAVHEWNRISGYIEISKLILGKSSDTLTVDERSRREESIYFGKIVLDFILAHDPDVIRRNEEQRKRVDQLNADLAELRNDPNSRISE